jgi:hypothetical protein
VCNCHPDGSTGSQCDKRTGACPCRKGFSGRYCDECARGTTGNVPQCTQCGECFDNWSTTLFSLKDSLDDLEDRASNLAVSSGSSVSDFSTEYGQLMDQLNDIKKMIAQNYTDTDVTLLAGRLQKIE